MSKRDRSDGDYRAAARRFLDRELGETPAESGEDAVIAIVNRLARGEAVNGLRLLVIQAGTELEEV